MITPHTLRRSTWNLILLATLFGGALFIGATRVRPATGASLAPAPVAAAPAPVVGHPAPAFTLRTPDGATVALADLRGTVVLVNFWATWCEPCLEEMPSLEDLQDRLKDRPFTLLAVNMEESDARVEQFLQSTLLQEDSLVVLFDRFGTVAKEWKARMLPVSFLIGPDGRIRDTVLGAADWSAKQTVSRIERLMPVPSASGSR